ncbi:hypothetical protein HUO09_18490 [Vibrio sp. Y2-5]|uniref:hypothetical protein n=1 Tax=Vibrio sp. Y2-5 TaxID=2743977 RepID=UPI0016613598|nr:hypothetical protein [Vibrio sp. Y2-5]MBD0788350.1 hypothetical protein [Vibrio sp. Y2-5]
MAMVTLVASLGEMLSILILREFNVGVKYNDWTLKFGNMDYLISSGFIVMDSNSDVGSDAEFFLEPRTAFQKSVIFSWEKQTMATQIFSLNTDDDSMNNRLTGANYDYYTESNTNIGLSAFEVFDIEGLTVNQLHAKVCRYKTTVFIMHILTFYQHYHLAVNTRFKQEVAMV